MLQLLKHYTLSPPKAVNRLILRNVIHVSDCGNGEGFEG